MYRTERSIRTSLILGSVTTVVLGLGVAATPAAHAGLVECSTDATNNYWDAECTRNPVDDDAGGVSGRIWMSYWLDGVETGQNMISSFDALGEDVWANNTSDENFVVELWADGVLEYEVTVPAWDWVEKDLDLGENKDVWLRVKEDDEDNYVIQDDFVS